MENGIVASGELLTTNDEIISMARYIMQGVKLTPEKMALDVIHQQGPQKQYLDTDHTLNNFKKELWLPKLLDRNVFAKWEEQGRKSMSQRVNEKTKWILENHVHKALDKKIKSEIVKIREKSHRERVK